MMLSTIVSLLVVLLLHNAIGTLALNEGGSQKRPDLITWLVLEPRAKLYCVGVGPLVHPKPVHIYTYIYIYLYNIYIYRYRWLKRKNNFEQGFLCYLLKILMSSRAPSSHGSSEHGRQGAKEPTGLQALGRQKSSSSDREPHRAASSAGGRSSGTSRPVHSDVGFERPVKQREQDPRGARGMALCSERVLSSGLRVVLPWKFEQCEAALLTCPGAHRQSLLTAGGVCLTQGNFMTLLGAPLVCGSITATSLHVAGYFLDKELLEEMRQETSTRENFNIGGKKYSGVEVWRSSRQELQLLCVIWLCYTGLRRNTSSNCPKATAATLERLLHRPAGLEVVFLGQESGESLLLFLCLKDQWWPGSKSTTY